MGGPLYAILILSVQKHFRKVSPASLIEHFILLCTKIYNCPLGERSSITSAHWMGVGGLTENTDTSQVKIDDVILEHMC